MSDDKDAPERAADYVRPDTRGDMKAARNQQTANTGRDRPKLSILQYNGMVYSAAGTTYGADKYARGNYFGKLPTGVSAVDRFLEYLDAAMRHIGKMAHAINVAKGTGGDQRAACALPDDEASGGFPASNLPHIAHAIAGLMIAVECGVTDGLLPADPGQPWKRDPMYTEVLARRGALAVALAQKNDPDAEHTRVTGGPVAKETRAEYDKRTGTTRHAVGARVCIVNEDSEQYRQQGEIVALSSIRQTHLVRFTDESSYWFGEAEMVVIG